VQEPDQSPNAANDAFGFKHCNTIPGKISTMDFSSATKAGTSSKQFGLKKQATYNNVMTPEPKDDSDKSCRDTSKYIILPEYKSEFIYQELLPKLENYNQVISSNLSLWREHAAFLHNFSECIPLFHVPEIHDAIVPTLM
jgi:hypothetical protein